MLTTRAARYLATLKRGPYLPTKEVEKIILTQGCPCFPPWLDFHERYAGYQQDFGEDGAIWGLVHANPVSPFWRPYVAYVDSEPGGEQWYISCADTHPTYQFRLDERGEFVSPPAESFDIYIERTALRFEFYAKGPTKEIHGRDKINSPEMQEIFNREVKSHLVPEASDQYFRYYMSERHFVVEDVEDGEISKIRYLVT